MRKDKVIAEVFGEELTLTPSDLCHHDVGRQLLFGYKRRAMNSLLERAADVLEMLVEQVRDLKTENDELRERLEEHRQMESTLRNALVSSQKFSEEIVESARREAAALLGEARVKRSEALMEAARIPEALAREIRMLEEQQLRFRREMLSVLDAHRHLLDNHFPERAGDAPGSFFEVEEVRKRVEALVAFEEEQPPASLEDENFSGDSPSEDKEATVEAESGFNEEVEEPAGEVREAPETSEADLLFLEDDEEPKENTE